MKAVIELINGKWTVNGKQYDELTAGEIQMLNVFFAEWKHTTQQLCNKACLERAKELYVHDPIVLPTKVFDEAFNHPIDQLKNL